MFTALATPFILAHLGRRQRDEEHARQDQRAAAAAAAARLLLDGQRQVAAQAREAARLLAANNRIVNEAAGQTQNQLATIHGLVNSNLTAALQAQLRATQAQLVMMRREAAREAAAGRPASAADLAELAAVQADVDELQARVNDRLNSDSDAAARSAVRAEDVPPATAPPPTGFKGGAAPRAD